MLLKVNLRIIYGILIFAGVNNGTLKSILKFYFCNVALSLDVNGTLINELMIFNLI